MADIKRAACWMQKGKYVRRQSEPLEVYHSSEHFDGAVCMSRADSIGGFARMTIDALTANDWEIVDQ